MPKETKECLLVALSRLGTTQTDLQPFEIVDKLCKVFSERQVDYGTFSYDDLLPYLPE